MMSARLSLNLVLFLGVKKQNALSSLLCRVIAGRTNAKSSYPVHMNTVAFDHKSNYFYDYY